MNKYIRRPQEEHADYKVDDYEFYFLETDD